MAGTGGVLGSGGVELAGATGGVAVDAAGPVDADRDLGSSAGGGGSSDAPADADISVTDMIANGDVDAGRDAPASSAACAGLFCEDFEKGVIDPATWQVQVNGGQSAPNLVTQPGLVAHGKYAAHFHANPNVVSYDFMITKNPPAALAGHHFGRAYFMITPMPPANHTEYVYAGTTGFPEYKYLEIASVASSTWQLTYVNLVPPDNGEDYHSGGKVPLGKWFCLEWELSDAPDRAVVYVDGAQDFTQNAFTYKGASTGLVGGFAAFGFGFYAWHPATYPFDVYYDDIVLDIKRVGCVQ